MKDRKAKLLGCQTHLRFTFASCYKKIDVDDIHARTKTESVITTKTEWGKNSSRVHAVAKNFKVQSRERLRPRPSLHMAEACKGTQTLSQIWAMPNMPVFRCLEKEDW